MPNETHANVTLHPASLMLALDKEADAWAEETNLAASINRMSLDPATREILTRFSKNCFVGGAYRGARNAAAGKPLFEEPNNG